MTEHRGEEGSALGAIGAMATWSFPVRHFIACNCDTLRCSTSCRSSAAPRNSGICARPDSSGLVAVCHFLARHRARRSAVGFHRYFSHRSFETTRPIALTLLVLGSMAGRGPMIFVGGVHRRHHQTSDRER